MKQHRRSSVRLSADEVDAATFSPGRLFLGRFDVDTLRAELERVGVLAVLRAKGYDPVVIETSLEAGQHRLRVRPSSRGPILVDLRVSEGAFPIAAPGAVPSASEIPSVLSVDWVALQDPKGRFSPDKPRLPGQRYPGLGAAMKMQALVGSWAKSWGKDAIINMPEHYHNAVFYSPACRFVDPVVEGRFEALRRDLAALTVAEASWSVKRGHVVDRQSGARFVWTGSPMMAALTATARRHVESDAYRRAVEDAARSASFYRLSPPQASQGHNARSIRKL